MKLWYFLIVGLRRVFFYHFSYTELFCQILPLRPPPPNKNEMACPWTSLVTVFSPNLIDVLYLSTHKKRLWF